MSPTVEVPHAREQAIDSTIPCLLPRRQTHVPELDGLRGIAILMVLFFHAFALTMQNAKWSGLPRTVELATRFGWAGVDLFFVLSGFLITGILLDSAGKPHYFRNFYARRALRILPLYYLTLVFIAVFYKGSLDFVGVSAIYLSNVSPIFGIAASYSTLWSLSVEEHFYLIWPWLVARLTPRRIWMFAAAIFLAEPFIRGIGFLYGADVYSYTWFRLDGLAAGALLASFVRSRWYSKERLYELGLFCVGIAVIVAAVSPPYHTLVGDALLFTFSTLLFTGLLSVVLSAAVPPLGRSMQSRWLRKCGEWSYFLYLAHPFFFHEWDQVFGVYPALVVNELGRLGALCIRAVAVFAICFILAELSRRYFEGPLLRLKRLFAYSQTTNTRPAQA